MFRKFSALIGLLIVSLGLTAFSGLSQEAGQGGGIPWWVWVLIILVLVVLFWWWLRRRSEAVPPPQTKVEAVPLPQVKAEPAPLPQVKAEAPAPVAKPAPVVPDDLKLIEGIGPKIAGILAAAGITTFAQLATTDVSRLRQIIAQAGLAALADPGTWPEQAALAAAGSGMSLKPCKINSREAGGSVNALGSAGGWAEQVRHWPPCAAWS